METRVCLAGLLGWFGLLSQFSKHFYFAKRFWQLIFKNGDDCLDKIFSNNFRKNKIGFIKNNFCCQKNMRCDDADVMMMQKEKQTNSNLGKTPGHYKGFGGGAAGDEGKGHTL